LTPRLHTGFILALAIFAGCSSSNGGAADAEAPANVDTSTLSVDVDAVLSLGGINDAGVVSDSSTAADGPRSNADGATAPGAPTEVTPTAGTSPNTVSIRIGATNNGGSPIVGYKVISSPVGLTADGSASPIVVACPSSCAGYAFSVIAINAIGDSTPSALTDVITAYSVFETFLEPETQPENSMFIGAFIFDSTTSIVSNLHGVLSESMTGDQVSVYPNDNMTWLTLSNQLSFVNDATLGGLLVTTFLLTTTNTLYAGTAGDGWTPGTARGVYYGFPVKAANPGNAYARIFVNTSDPTATLTQAQIDKLAYADCAPGGMMGSACMTGTTVAGYGELGTMKGYPVSQTITKQ
jgi:hypothetical protein